MRHPSRRYLKVVFACGFKYADEDVNYSVPVEMILVNEFKALSKESDPSRMFLAPQVASQVASYFGDNSEGESIDVLELSVRAYIRLIRANIKTVPELLQLPDEELETIQNMGQKSANEIREKLKQFIAANTIESKTNILPLNTRPDYDYMIYIKECIDKKEFEKLFDMPGQISITRTGISIKTMIYLLKNGCFYLNQFLSNPEFVVGCIRNWEYRDDINRMFFKTHTMLRIRISSRLSSAFQKKGIHTLNDTLDRVSEFKEGQKNDLIQVLQIISETYSRIDRENDAINIRLAYETVDEE